MSYSIYHIPGVKIGVSINPEKRVRAQGYTNYEIIEVHLSKVEASKRELELQSKYGYTKDCIPYHIFVNGTNQSKGGRIGTGGKVVMAGPHGERIRSMGGKVGGKKRAEQITFEELSNAGKVGGKVASSNLNTFMGGYVVCTHCGKTTNKGNHNRWHGDKCKKK